MHTNCFICFFWGEFQVDRDLYRAAMQNELFHCTPNLTIREAAVEDLLVEHDVDSGVPKVTGVVLASGEAVRSNTVVLTTGTSDT